ncbi:hypothetical protein BEN47_06845 [Hymenobacter lapidarius]|uniref:Beta-lactamase-inhibitor-like PepSY-like domain-containing protein n=1 Tax=Hymenobacter lapidarius TaxID=1908237 RepID=A0A1G1TFE2_9BACT|nr:hypothetical protein [Hymenobacter lapidarius]OGX89594.1 hypothetical protein BEN47_06845 [Hymenobacter lapidarius]
MKYILFSLSTLLFLLSAPAVQAQAAAPAGSVVAAAPAAVALVQVYYTRKGFRAEFDTDGKSLGGLSQAELNEKFKVVTSPVAVINFVVQSGYRVASFSTTQAGAGADLARVSVTNGYVFLCESVR